MTFPTEEQQEAATPAASGGRPAHTQQPEEKLSCDQDQDGPADDPSYTNA